MIKNNSINRILKTTILLIALIIFLKFPSKNKYSLKIKKVMKNNNYHDIFLLDENDYLSKTTVPINNEETIYLKDELLNILKCNKENNKILNGFKCVIPNNLDIKSKINNDSIDIYLSKEFSNYSDSIKEKIIESIVYTLTSINSINNINIYVDNNLYKENLNRSYGINKKYDLSSLNDINNVTIYYINKINDYEYYIPVTKYTNSNEDKIKVIIEELSSKSSYESNLMSYLNYETKLINYDLDGDKLDLYFNEYLFDNSKDKKVLEEVIYSIKYSLQDTINVSNINIFVNNQEI